MEQRTDISEAKTVTAPRTAKPGASVQISADYDGKTSLYETENFTLTFKDGYAAGTLRVKIIAADELDLWSVEETSFSMAGHDPHTLDVSLSSSVEGRHYLTVQVMAELPGGMVFPATRGFAINVGNAAAQQKSQPDAKLEARPSGDTVMEMEADERIESEG
ncbi:MAG: hypothetical protein CMK09_03570 [Ponticaulis sp.]|nr:hypothetical protein [Ponticaulis sp.]